MRPSVGIASSGEADFPAAAHLSADRVRDLARSLTKELQAAPPPLHGAGDEYWGLAWRALAWLEREVRPGMATLETGAGSSTIVFAAGGAVHEAVTPDPAEEDRIRAECDRRGIATDGVTFRIGPSHEVLPHLEPRPLDLVLVDGAHGFPYPILDWWWLAPRVRVGGRIVLDDAYMPPVGALVDTLRRTPSWRLDPAPSRRTAVLRKVDDALPPYDWGGEPVGGRMNFRYLPPARRARAAVEHRVLESRLGRRAAALTRRRLR
jgi:predicted O-methyltransferase YrrM